MTAFQHTPRPLFQLGRVVATIGADELPKPLLLDCLTRHVQGDWGCIDAEDRETNDDALRLGNRILSAYAIDPARPSKGYGENTLWIITEADRSATTLLLPDEY